jgi:hypothetical protein
MRLSIIHALHDENEKPSPACTCVTQMMQHLYKGALKFRKHKFDIHPKPAATHSRNKLTNNRM